MRLVVFCDECGHLLLDHPHDDTCDWCVIENGPCQPSEAAAPGRNVETDNDA